MRRVTAIVAGGLGLLLLTGAGYMYADSAAAARLSRKYEVRGRDIPIPYPLSAEELAEVRAGRAAAPKSGTSSADDAPPSEGRQDPPFAPPEDLLSVDALDAIARTRAVARGKALALGRAACAECHGADGRGKLVVDAQPVWTWFAPNITRGGRTRSYTSRDWDRIIRHGVKPDGTAATMPAIDFVKLSDQEVSDLAAYFSELPPSDVAQPPTVLGPVGKALIGFGQMPLSAEDIDHTREHPPRPPRAQVDTAFGEHVAATCVGCHREDFSGGPIAQGPPDWPAAGNLTPHQEGISGWSEADFLRVLREGKRPDGSTVREPMLAVTKIALSEVELRAMYAYLRQVPARATGQ